MLGSMRGEQCAALFVSVVRESIQGEQSAMPFTKDVLESIRGEQCAARSAKAHQFARCSDVMLRLRYDSPCSASRSCHPFNSGCSRSCYRINRVPSMRQLLHIRYDIVCAAVQHAAQRFIFAAQQAEVTGVQPQGRPHFAPAAAPTVAPACVARQYHVRCGYCGVNAWQRRVACVRERARE